LFSGILDGKILKKTRLFEEGDNYNEEMEAAASISTITGSDEEPIGRRISSKKPASKVEENLAAKTKPSIVETPRLIQKGNIFFFFFVFICI
jgi:hypothetical protein